VTKVIERPPIVHQLREFRNGVVTTKCGKEGKAAELPHSSWHVDITCDECSP
jgi:hypothetical protein